MKMKIGQIVNQQFSKAVLQLAENKDLPLLVQWDIATVTKEVGKIEKRFAELNKKLVEKYETGKDENGQPRVESSKLDEAKRKEFIGEYTALMEKQVDMPLPKKIKIPAQVNGKDITGISPGTLVILDDLIERA